MLVYQVLTAFPAVPKGGKEPVWFTRSNEHTLRDSLSKSRLKELEEAGAVRSWDDGTPEPDEEEEEQDPKSTSHHVSPAAGRASTRKKE